MIIEDGREILEKERYGKKIMREKGQRKREVKKFRKKKI